jgi:hypothetical protein
VVVVVAAAAAEQPIAASENIADSAGLDVCAPAAEPTEAVAAAERLAVEIDVDASNVAFDIVEKPDTEVAAAVKLAEKFAGRPHQELVPHLTWNFASVAVESVEARQRRSTCVAVVEQLILTSPMKKYYSDYRCSLKVFVERGYLGAWQWHPKGSPNGPQ